MGKSQLSTYPTLPSVLNEPTNHNTFDTLERLMKAVDPIWNGALWRMASVSSHRSRKSRSSSTARNRTVPTPPPKATRATTCSTPSSARTSCSSDNSAQSLSIIRKLALHMAKSFNDKRSVRRRLFKASLDPNYNHFKFEERTGRTVKPLYLLCLLKLLEVVLKPKLHDLSVKKV